MYAASCGLHLWRSPSPSAALRCTRGRDRATAAFDVCSAEACESVDRFGTPRFLTTLAAAVNNAVVGGSHRRLGAPRLLTAFAAAVRTTINTWWILAPTWCLPALCTTRVSLLALLASSKEQFPRRQSRASTSSLCFVLCSIQTTNASPRHGRKAQAPESATRSPSCCQ